MAKTPTRSAEVTAAKNSAQKPASRNGRGIVESAPRNTAKSPTAPAGTSPLDNPEFYVNRELSLLEFQKRVLEEAQDETVPLLERVKFLSIVGSNLDEFFMVRVAGLKRQVEKGVLECGPDGMTPAEQLTAVRKRVGILFREAHECWQSQVMPSLRKAGIEVTDYSQLTNMQRSALNRYFRETIFPSLTPVTLDPGRPFPHISNLSLN